MGLISPPRRKNLEVVGHGASILLGQMRTSGHPLSGCPLPNRAEKVVVGGQPISTGGRPLERCGPEIRRPRLESGGRGSTARTTRAVAPPTELAGDVLTPVHRASRDLRLPRGLDFETGWSRIGTLQENERVQKSDVSHTYSRRRCSRRRCWERWKISSNPISSIPKYPRTPPLGPMSASLVECAMS